MQITDYKWSDRIDYDGISKKFQDLVPLLTSDANIILFSELTLPIIQSVIKDYYFLLDDKHYIKNEFATIFIHLRDCLENIMPKHLNYRVIFAVSTQEFIFIPAAS